MENENPSSTPLAEGDSGQTPEPQITEPQTQVPAQQEPANSSSEVETSDSQASSRDRTRPSQFYADRRRLQRLETTIQNQFNQIQQLVDLVKQTSARSSGALKQVPTTEEFYSDPLGFINKILDERESKIKGYIPEAVGELSREHTLKAQEQEAVKMIRTNENVKKDPNGEEVIKDILLDPEYGLNEMSKFNPIGAAKIALKLYSESLPGVRRGANSPTASQMRSTATGSIPAKSQSAEEEAKKLTQELAANPSLAFDPKFQERLNLLKQKRLSVYA